MGRFKFSLLTIMALSSCLQDAEVPSSRFEVGIAPLALPGVGKICYDLRVSDGPVKTDPQIWAKGTPGLNGGSGDADALCSTSFGNGSGGDITYIGACAASPLDAGQDYRTNSVTVWVDGVYDASNVYLSPTGADGWQNPCPDGCTLTAPCRENGDTPVVFNLTILRQANQGFFDIGVNFQDIFCSAKVDCKNDSGAPLNLLFRPGTSTRDRTIVSAFACTAGAGAAVDTVLYRDPLVITCGISSPTTVTLNPGASRGNAWATDPTAGDAVFQYATYADEENLSCAGQNCQKRFWNVAIGLDTNATDCRLQTRMTAADGDLAAFTTPTASTYPFIDVDLVLTTGSALTCAKHALNSGSAVTTRYTPISSPESFEYSFDGVSFAQAAPTCSSPCQNGGVCSVGGVCQCSGPWTGSTCSTPATITSGLVIHVDAANASSYILNSSTWFDLTAPQTNGTISGGVTYSSSGGGSLDFNGSTGTVAFGSDATLNTVDCTVSMWVNLDDVTSVQVLAGRYGQGMWNGWEFVVSSGGVRFAGRESSAGYLMTDPAPVITQTWYQLTGVKKGNLWSVYVNGALHNSKVQGLGTTAFQTMGLVVGQEWNGYYTNGRIADFQVYTRALSASEIGHNFSVNAARFGL